MHDRLPRRTDEQISVQVVGEETLLYDESRHMAFCLNRTSSAVWNLCDGEHTEAQIVAALDFRDDRCLSDELVSLALEQLRQDGLIEAVPANRPLLSRREMVEALGARSLMMLPVVAAICVPEAAQALSGVVDGDGTGSRASKARRQSMTSDPAPSKSDPW